MAPYEQQHDEIPVAGSGVAVAPPSLQGRGFKHMLIDLDDTLYQNPEVSAQVLAAIKSYMHERLGMNKDEVENLAYSYYSSHGTTLAGLVASGYKIDYNDWHEYVHHFLDYEELLQPNETLKNLLQSIPLPKWIFTNADKKHAENCLNAMGIAECFDGVACFESLMDLAARDTVLEKGSVICKPNPEAFRLALEAAGMEASTTVFLDDSVKNVMSATECGIHSVLVKPGDGHWPGQTIGSILEIADKLPQLLGQTYSAGL